MLATLANFVAICKNISGFGGSACRAENGGIPLVPRSVAPRQRILSSFGVFSASIARARGEGSEKLDGERTELRREKCCLKVERA